MKKKSLLSIMLFICLGCSKKDEDVEGFQIKYNVNISSENEDINERMKSQNPFGDSMELLIANGYYKQFFPTGRQSEYTIYNYQKNEQYQSYKGLDTLYYLNCDTETRKLHSEVINNEEMKIAGYDCKCSTFKTDNITYKVCYSGEVLMETNKFSNHKWGFFNKLMETSQGPYLYFELIYPHYSVSYKAQKVEKLNLNTSEFFPSQTLRKEVRF